MKKILSILLIALLALAFIPHAVADLGESDGGQKQYVFVDDDILSQEELEPVNARAREIAARRGVGVYYFYYEAVGDLPAYIEQFAREHVTEENAVVLGFNSGYYYFLQIGPIAKTALPDDVFEVQIFSAYRAVTGDPQRKLLAYLNAADGVLAEYLKDPLDVPDELARTAGGKPTLADTAHLLRENEAKQLSERLRAIGDAYQCDVVVVTVPALNGKTPEEYADDFFDYNGYGYGATPDENGVTVDGDGVLLLLSMEDRDFHISTSGYAITAFTDYGLQAYLEPQFLPYLKDNGWYAGFLSFADGCEYLLKTAREGEPFDVFNASEKTAGGKAILVDQAALFTQAQIRELSEKLKALGDKYQCDVIFVTDADPGFTDADSYARDFYQKYGYGYRITREDGSVDDRGGILLCYFVSGNQLSVYTDGFAKTVFKGRGLYKFRQDLLRAIYHNSDEFSEDVIETYENRSDWYFEQAANGHPYNPINWIPIVIAIAAGALFAFLPVNAMKRQLTDVGRQTRADSYMQPDSFLLTQNSDVLLGTNVSRSVHVVRTDSGGGGGRTGGGGGFHGGSSTHTSSSGGTHGGHGGKF